MVVGGGEDAVERVEGGAPGGGGGQVVEGAGGLAWPGREGSLGQVGIAGFIGGGSARLERLLGRGAIARLAGARLLARPGRDCSLGRGGSARFTGAGVLALPGRECSLSRGAIARLAGAGLLTRVLRPRA